MDSLRSRARTFFGILGKRKKSVSPVRTVSPKFFADMLATLYAVEFEFYLHDSEYHYKTSLEVREAVRKAICELGGQPKR
jgi:hypothetical protein